MPDASFCLAPGVAFEPGQLRDNTGRTYALNPAGEATCAIAAEHPVDVRVVTALLAELRNEDAGAVEAAVSAFVSDLNRRGLVSVHQSFGREWVDSLAVLPMHLLENRRINWSALTSEWYVYRRYRPTLKNVLRACLEGHQVSMWALLGVVVGAAIATVSIGVPSGPELAVTLPGIVSVLSCFALVHFLSLLIHELMHYAAARATDSPMTSVYLRPGAVGIAFRSPTVRAKALTLAAGASGAILFLLGALALILFGPNEVWAAAGIDQLRLSAVVAVAALIAGQLLSFTPLTRDGRQLAASLIEAVRQRRTE